jgi:hypothetical protein
MFMRGVAFLVAVLLAGCTHREVVVQHQPKGRPATTMDAKSAIVAASIYGYEISTGQPCPCPYSKGGACKGQSAWDRAGGAEPRCYRSDVTPEDVKRWRELSKKAPERP